MFYSRSLCFFCFGCFNSFCLLLSAQVQLSNQSELVPKQNLLFSNKHPGHLICYLRYVSFIMKRSQGQTRFTATSQQLIISDGHDLIIFLNKFLLVYQLKPSIIQRKYQKKTTCMAKYHKFLKMFLVLQFVPIIFSYVSHYQQAHPT